MTKDSRAVTENRDEVGMSWNVNVFMTKLECQCFRDEVECQHSRNGVECHLEAFLITGY